MVKNDDEFLLYTLRRGLSACTGFNTVMSGQAYVALNRPYMNFVV